MRPRRLEEHAARSFGLPAKLEKPAEGGHAASRRVPQAGSVLASAGGSLGAALLPRPDPPEIVAGFVTARVRGFDPGAPRGLTLWRVEDGRAAPAGETASEADGRFAFSGIPAAGQELVVAAGAAPPTADAVRVRMPGLVPLVPLEPPARGGWGTGLVPAARTVTASDNRSNGSR